MKPGMSYTAIGLAMEMAFPITVTVEDRSLDDADVQAGDVITLDLRRATRIGTPSPLEVRVTRRDGNRLTVEPLAPAVAP